MAILKRSVESEFVSVSERIFISWRLWELVKDNVIYPPVVSMVLTRWPTICLNDNASDVVDIRNITLTTGLVLTFRFTFLNLTAITGT